MQGAQPAWAGQRGPPSDGPRQWAGRGRERGPAKAGPAKGGPAKDGPAKAGPAKGGTAKNGPAKAGPAKRVARLRVYPPKVDTQGQATTAAGAHLLVNPPGS